MKLLATLTLACAGVFGFLYILQVNALTAQAYHMGEYETEKQQLSDRNKTLESSAIRILSMKNFEDLATLMNFEKAYDISYIKITEPAVAATNTR
ncbi:MAG: hypothetical protein Q7S62_02955 [bacterium]|nr:hypothetical protein [bacterium]